MVEWNDLTDEQQTAAGSLDRNVSLTAGAGTGKTTALTARVMRILRQAVDEAITAVEGTDDPAVEALPVRPQHILTTTFTERAAGELRESIRKEVNAELDATTGATHECWRALADDLESGYIHTLHGFCSRLLREHALEAESVQPGFETLDEDETTALIRRVTRRTLESEADSEALRMLGARYDRGTVTDIIVGLLEQRPESLDWAARWQDATVEDYIEHVWTDLHPISPEFAQATFEGASGDALNHFVDLVDEQPDVGDSDKLWTKIRDIVARLEEAGLPAADGASVDDRTRQRCVNDLCDILTGSRGDRYADSSYEGSDSNWPDDDLQATAEDAMATLLAWLEPAETLVDADIEADRIGFPQVRAVATLVDEVGRRYRQEKRDRNLVDYTDQIGFARSFLVEEAAPETREELRERFAFVMVDEFQDTDPRQWDIVRALTSTDPAEFDARNVFVVGDTKQSIYRFRNADVTMFGEVAAELAAANRAAGTESDGTASDDQLSENFRTLPNVLEVINGLFDRTFRAGEAAPFEADPQRLAPYRDDPDDIDATVEYLCVPTDEALLAELYESPPIDPATATSSTALEAEALAARLTQVLDGARQVYPTEEDTGAEEPAPPVLNRDVDEEPDAEASEARPIAPEDIAILLRSRTHLKTYERALSEADIPYTVASGQGFYEAPEIEALLNLFRVLVDPHDERALYGVLRSPLFGCTDDAIAQLRVESPEATLWSALGRTSSTTLADAHELLEHWRSQAGLDEGDRMVESWADLLTAIIETTGYLVAVSAGERSQQAVANVEKFREQLRDWGDEGSVSLPVLLDRIEDRIAHADREGEATIPEDSDGVQVMTVHDAKGDEFPMVVVPRVDRGFMDRGAIADGKAEFESMPTGPALGLKGPDPADPMADTDTIARVGIRRRRRREERAEEKRILYVACTRARDHLLLSGAHDVDSDADPTSDGLQALADADPDGADSWRDWLQAAFFEDELLDELAEDHHATGVLDDGVYDLRLPAPEAAWSRAAASTDVRTDIGTAPTTAVDPTYRLSPSSLGQLFAGEASLVHDEARNVLTLGDADDGSESVAGEHDAGNRLPATVFGDIVHKLAELQPPADRWQPIAEEYITAHETATLAQLDMDRLRTHAERAIAYVESRGSEQAVQGIHHERFVTAEFDQGEVGGFIDCLLVTEEAFHVIDYKTSQVTAETVRETAEEYQPQLEAYAVALGQQETDRAIRTTLFFTEIDEAVSATYSPDEISELEVTFEERIRERLAHEL